MWSNDQTAELKHYAARGWTAGQIGDQLGVSRNAVIGKCNRIGIQLKNGNPVLTPEQRKARKAARDAKRCFYPSRRPRTMPRLPTASPAPANAPLSRNLPLVELGPMDCRYPTNEAEQRDGHLFCGAIKDYAGPYCPYHAVLAHDS